jgi:4,5-dihydroxyphthalate decarboxylase
MSRLPITIATWDYDRVRPLVDGRVQIRLRRQLSHHAGRGVLRARLLHGEFEVAEIGSAPLRALSRAPALCRGAGVPVAQTGTRVYIRTDRGIEGPGDCAASGWRRNIRCPL